MSWSVSQILMPFKKTRGRVLSGLKTRGEPKANLQYTPALCLNCK